MEAFPDKKPAILIIDDDKDMMELLRRKLVKEGCEVNISPNGAKINELIADGNPDCILLDIHMEGINGTDICKKLKAKEETKDIPVLLLSGNHNIEKIAALCGADGHIAKPLDISLFAQKIKAVLKLRYFL
jgi:DNA-binding response OmpR family regulator